MTEPIYIRYDRSIWELPETDLLQRLILNHIWSFNQRGLQCFTSVPAFSDIYQLHPDVIVSSMENLIDMGYLKIEKDGPRNILCLDLDRKAHIRSYWEGNVFDV